MSEQALSQIQNPPQDDASAASCLPAAQTRDDEENETSLIARCQSGDLEAFDHLMDLHQARIYNLAYRMTGFSEDASDVTQETFLRAFNALPRFRGECAFSTWLFRIACNIALDEIKRRSRQKIRTAAATLTTETGEQKDLIEQTSDPGPDPQEILERRERQMLVQQAIATLPEHQRAVLVLYDIQGEAYEQIAQILNISVGTVKSRLNRARLALKNRLELLREQL